MDETAKLRAAVNAALAMLANRDVQIINLSVDVAVAQARIAELEKTCANGPDTSQGS